MLGTEKLISRVFPHRFLHRKHSVYPNRENTYWESIQGFWGVERYDAPSKIPQAIHPQQVCVTTVHTYIHTYIHNIIKYAST